MISVSFTLTQSLLSRWSWYFIEDFYGQEEVVNIYDTHKVESSSVRAAEHAPPN